MTWKDAQDIIHFGGEGNTTKEQMTNPNLQHEIILVKYIINMCSNNLENLS